MAVHCGNDNEWHGERGLGGGHYGGDGVTWCSGRQPEQLFNLEQAKVIGRRALCDTGDEGHDIQLTIRHRIRNWNGTVAVDGYSCTKCDVKVSLSYPELT